MPTPSEVSHAGPGAYPERALRLFPGGSNGEFGLPPQLLPVIDRGLGAHVWDTAGRDYLDLTMAWGSILLGHAHPAILEAAARQARLGTNFASLNRPAVELAERLQALCPCAEQVRFVNSGSEATLLALRIVFSATHRRRILKFAGAYHGQHPVGVAGMLHGADSADGQANTAGAGWPGVEHDVVVAPFNDLQTTSALIRQHATELAGVIVEPFHRCLSPAPGFLQGLRELTRHHGLVLIFDETVTGFRLAAGGAQAYYGVTPDMATYGKALGAGFPLGACVGRADLMDLVNEHRIAEPRYVWSASTSGGNPVSCAAALALLRILEEPGTYTRLHAIGAAFRQCLRESFQATGEPVQVLGDGPIAQAAFSAQPITDHASWQAANRQRSRLWMEALIGAGIFINPLGTKLYLSLAHDEAALDEFADRLGRALRQLPSRPG